MVKLDLNVMNFWFLCSPKKGLTTQVGRGFQ